MRVLILGATGMLGHKLWQVFRTEFDTYAGVRRGDEVCAKYDIFDANRMETNLDARDFRSFHDALSRINPDVVINCVGIVRQLSKVICPADIIEVNSLFPHRLANLCALSGARLIHVSTDCVFSGQRGMYTEADNPDPVDLYGRTKYLGEIATDGCLTIRTSMIGQELREHLGLLEWFLSQDGKRVQGYTRVIFSGLATVALAEILIRVVADFGGLTGIYHVSSEPISKHDLLVRFKEAFLLNVEIEPFEENGADTSLDSSRFTNATGITAPNWDEMIDGLVADTTPYSRWRS